MKIEAIEDEANWTWEALAAAASFRFFRKVSGAAAAAALKRKFSKCYSCKEPELDENGGVLITLWASSTYFFFGFF